MIERYKGHQPKPVKIKPCKACTSLGHTAWQCPKRPRKPLKQTKGLVAKKRMKPIGKIGRKLMAQADRFRKEHPGPQQCFYCEYIGIYELIDVYNVEHPYSKARHPDMRFDYDRLIVACPSHNEDKGSLDIEDYLLKLETQKEDLYGR